MASINHNNAKNQNNDNSNIITLIAVLPKHFTYINLWDPYNNPMRWTLFKFQFTDKLRHGEVK